MKSNFGRRWEGETQWLSPNGLGSLAELAEPMRSIYQLEFPPATANLGTWRGWNVVKDGDTRVVPLSEESVLFRTPGSSTFQFEGVGGRCDLDTDGAMYGIEVNFFFSDRRSGLVIYYKEDEGGALCLHNIMRMAFRSAPISHDGGATFVDTPTFTVAQQPDPLEAPAQRNESPPLRLPRSACARHVVLARPDYEHCVVAGPPSTRCDIDCNGTTDEAMFAARLADGVLLHVPRNLRADPCASLLLGCDFRSIGGPVRTVSAELSQGKIARWVSADYIL